MVKSKKQKYAGVVAIGCPKCGNCEQLQAMVDLIAEDVGHPKAFICEAELFTTSHVVCNNCGRQGPASEFGLENINFFPEI
jgi:predicted nucleic-acid-binding Zn-ribbon protein